MALRTQRVDLRSLFARLKQFIALKAEIKQLKLTVRLDGDIPERVYTDKRRMMQILLNLCYNAVKYTFKGEITVTGHMAAEKLLEIEVRDTGIGIDPSFLAGICHMFGLVERKSHAHETGMLVP